MIMRADTSYRSRAPQNVREHEILRIAATFPTDASEKSISSAKMHLLRWAQKRSTGELPSDAWNGNGFEHFAGGRTTIGVHFSRNDAHIWALKLDDPDKHIPGRIWTTEITIGQLPNSPPRLSARLIVNTPEAELEIEPHVPGFMQQLVRTCGLRGGTLPFYDSVRTIDQSDIDELLAALENPDRRRPIIVATGDERSENPDIPLINAQLLAKATLGLAHVVVVPASLTYKITDRFGKARSVYHGAVRVYLPGFDRTSNPYEHRLFLSQSINIENGAKDCVSTLRTFAARDSLTRTRLNHEVLTFSSVRSASLKHTAEMKISEGAGDEAQLAAVREQIHGLEEELAKAKAWEDQLTTLHDDAEARAIAAEAQLRNTVVVIQSLQAHIKGLGNQPEPITDLPSDWSSFVEWCDTALAGRVTLSPTARRGIKKAEFEDPELAARSLRWLATECRDRLSEGGGSIAEHPIENGVRNASCGGDSYAFDFQGQRLAADWHVKNGGNTRDPARCLRIYYGWDEQSQQIVVADMPSHRRTGAS